MNTRFLYVNASIIPLSIQGKYHPLYRFKTLLVVSRYSRNSIFLKFISSVIFTILLTLQHGIQIAFNKITDRIY